MRSGSVELGTELASSVPENSYTLFCFRDRDTHDAAAVLSDVAQAQLSTRYIVCTSLDVVI